MELLRELMRKAERNQMMTQTLSLHQLEHKHAPDPRQAEWNAQKAAGQWPGWKGNGPPPKSVNPPTSSGRPPKMHILFGTKMIALLFVTLVFCNLLAKQVELLLSCTCLRRCPRRNSVLYVTAWNPTNS